MQSATGRPWVARFGAFEADLWAGELRKHGLKIKLQDQPFQILALLLAQPGQVVTREELRQKLWPADTFVDFNHGLNNAIQRLREALGDSADSPRYIETVPRRGYRLIVPGPPAEGSSARRQMALQYPLALAGALAALALVLLGMNMGGWRDRLLRPPVAIHSIAVLPLENLSGDPAQEFFADGMTDALITDLAKIGSLKVISRTSAMQYKSAKKALPQVARVWANSYERSPSDIIALQNEVARAIAGEIQVKLTPQERSRLSSRRAVNPEAYDNYLQGLYLYNKQSTAETFHRALQHMQKAVDQDPSFGLAYAGLADIYVWLGPPREAMPKAKMLAEKALAMDDTLGEAHSALARVFFYYEWDVAAAEREFKRSVQLDPGYALAHVWYAWYLFALARFDEAIAEARRAQELDPLSLLANWNVAQTLYFAQQYDRALEQCRRVLELDSNYDQAHATMARIYRYTGRYQEARAEFQKRAEIDPRSLSDLSNLASNYAASGDKAKARKLLAQALQQDQREGDFPAFTFASVNVALGNKDEALHWLEKSYENRDWPLVQLKVEPQWDPLRSDPRFQNLVRRVGLPP
jgi:TolB-like protein/DNA-binding winged helix-turn-helix (wHTH) protein/Tfp pilus assembly protein PilF